MQAALARSIELGEFGISVAAYHRGELIVDAFAGVADKTTEKPVDAQTLFPVFSVTKGVTALALHIQAERGFVDLNAPVAQYWPEFATNGKEGITVEHVLSHRAGIPQMPASTPGELADWEWMVQRVAEATPVFEPGKHNAYHVLVWGWIVGEIVRRTDPCGRSFRDFVRDEICSPLDVGDFHLGVSDDDLQRVATLYGGGDFGMVDTYGTAPPGVFPGGEIHNLRVMQQAVDPGAGAIATAQSVARIFAAIANGGELGGTRLLSTSRAGGLTRLREGAKDQDKILPIPVWFGAAGFWLGGEPGASDPIVGDHRDIVYSPGAGGSMAWADLREGLAVAICHNNMDTPMVTEPERTYAPIVDVIRRIVAERRGVLG
ncbi:beta-lactamase/transpeptidase-like protein [Plectosphaerella plurivora]|uniref:Beta-lactamase/transpeptidase-like protein n=1 Tax=Plectosphaerella plurivora TaxID=936078 RepID=A0A9P9A6K1_9PEZI|nr:beta-lactamase/transpeptidase-like protein [Plectosphaerella plurivora]